MRISSRCEYRIKGDVEQTSRLPSCDFQINNFKIFYNMCKYLRRDNLLPTRKVYFTCKLNTFGGIYFICELELEIENDCVTKDNSLSCMI